MHYYIPSIMLVCHWFPYVARGSPLSGSACNVDTIKMSRKCITSPRLTEKSSRQQTIFIQRAFSLKTALNKAATPYGEVFPHNVGYLCVPIEHTAVQRSWHARVCDDVLRAVGPAFVIDFTSSEPRDTFVIPTHGVDHLERCQSLCVADW